MGVSVDGSPVAGIIGQPFHGYNLLSSGGGSGEVPEDHEWDSMGRTVWGGRGLGVRGLGEILYTAAEPQARGFLTTSTGPTFNHLRLLRASV